MIWEFWWDGGPEDIGRGALKERGVTRIGEGFWEIKGWAGGKTNRPNGMGIPIYSEFKVVFTCNDISKGESWNWYMNERPSRPILLETPIEIVVIDIVFEVEL
jgi:hypothetical protein